MPVQGDIDGICRHQIHQRFLKATLTLQQAVTTILVLPLLNPHTYLDTVVLLGAVGAQLPAPGKPWFTFGAISASIAWFCALGFGARLPAHSREPASASTK